MDFQTRNSIDAIHYQKHTTLQILIQSINGIIFGIIEQLFLFSFHGYKTGYYLQKVNKMKNLSTVFDISNAQLTNNTELSITRIKCMQIF